MKTSRRTGFLTVVILLACSSSCSDSDSASGKDNDTENSHLDADAATAATADDQLEYFAGDIADSDIRVAVVARRSDARVRLFFCGGPDTVATATHWFNLELAGDADTAASEENGFVLNAKLGDDTVTGEFNEPGHDARSFTIDRVKPDTAGGLYEGKSDCGRLSLIASQADTDADIRAQGACVGVGRDPEQVNPIMPIALEERGIPVEIPGLDGTMVLQRAGIVPL